MAKKVIKNTENLVKNTKNNLERLERLHKEMSAGSVMTEGDKTVKPKGKAKPFMIQCRPPLVTAPITEDWRRFNAIHGISESRCVNYKEIYEEMRHGTISDCNLVTIIDYFK